MLNDLIARELDEQKIVFSEAEWAWMMERPYDFGYACPAERHFFPNGYDPRNDFCPKCEWEMDEHYERGLDLPPPSIPEKTIKCGSCRERHRTINAVKACYGLLD